MDYDFSRFLIRARETCKNKREFLHMIAEEDEAAAQSQAGVAFLAKDNYRHSLAVASIAATSRAMSDPRLSEKEELIMLLVQWKN